MLSIKNLVEEQCAKLNSDFPIVIPKYKYCGMVDGVPQLNNLFDTYQECYKIHKRVKAVMANSEEYEHSVKLKQHNAKLMIYTILGIIFKDKEKPLLSHKEESLVLQLMADTFVFHDEHYDFIHEFNKDMLIKMLNIIHLSV